MRDRLTLLITEHKSKIRQEENAAGITCKEIELNQALEEIINWQEKLADKKSSEVKKKEKEEGAAREEL